MNKHFILKILRKKGRIMKRFNTSGKHASKRTAVSISLIVLCVILLIAGVALILIEPIKRLNRKRITGDALKSVESKIETFDPENPRITYIVPVRGNEVEGEGYDFVGMTEEEEEEYEGDTVELCSIGILEISSIGIRYPVWDEASQISLRYGLGHYVDSVMPGEVGNATILGHNYRDGSMFHFLRDVEIGDEVVFTDLNGERLVFYVDEIEIISADELIHYALGNITKTRQLTLVTCTYEYGAEGWRRVVICRLAGEEEPEETAKPVETTTGTTRETEETEEQSWNTLETTEEDLDDSVWDDEET